MALAKPASKRVGHLDELWPRNMFEYHRGAIMMVRVELAQATYPQMRKLARMTDTAKVREIAQMQLGHAATVSCPVI